MSLNPNLKLPTVIRHRPLATTPKPAGRSVMETRRANPREAKQKALEALLEGANANKVRDIAASRPDLMDAASPDQRARMTKALLDKFFFGVADRTAILSILKPAADLVELNDALKALKGSNKLGSLFNQMSDSAEGLELSKFLLKNGQFADQDIVPHLGVSGVKSLVRIARNEDLDLLPRESKLQLIGILMTGGSDDESQQMITRIRHHMG